MVLHSLGCRQTNVKQAAETYLLRLIRLDPNFGRNFGNLGCARFMQNDLETAQASLQDCNRLAAGRVA